MRPKSPCGANAPRPSARRSSPARNVGEEEIVLAEMEMINV
jgi:hypothetical protein